MSDKKRLDALQSLCEAAGVAIACDTLDNDPAPSERVPAHASWAPAAVPTHATARGDISWAQPRFQEGFAQQPAPETPRHVLTTTFAQWLTSRMPTVRHG